MTKGQKLRIIIVKSLETLSLDVSQEASLAYAVSIADGTFEPTDIDIAMIDVQLMVLDENINGLITLLKRLPKVSEDSNGIKLFMDGESVPLDIYLGSNNVGKRTVSGVSSDLYSDMSLHEYSYTIHGSLKFSIYGVSNNMFGDYIPNNEKRHKKLNVFCPIAFELITKEVIAKELLYNFDLGCYENSDEVLESKKGEELLAYLTQVISNKKLVSTYLTKVWCFVENKKAEIFIAEVKPRVKPAQSELTEVPLTDEVLDAMDNVTVIGISKDGKLNKGGALL